MVVWLALALSYGGKEPVVDVDIESWMHELVEKLRDSFRDRLALVGLQGSRARGEARDGSDIDAVVLVDNLSCDDLAAYKAVIASMPCADIACGFISSLDLLAHWPRYDAFNLVKDTRVYHGSFDFMDTNFTHEEALLSAKTGASAIYHATVHALVFDEDSLAPTLDACVKSSFFVMRALRYADGKPYPASRATLREDASADDPTLLDAYDGSAPAHEALAQLLISWSEGVLTGQ